MIISYNNKLKQAFFWLVLTALTAAVSCKKGTFDINSPNPNALSPSQVPAKYYLTSSLAATAGLLYNGSNTSVPNTSFYGIDLLNTWMGYWATSGGTTPSPIVVTYQLTSDVGTGNWDDAYLNLKNYQLMRDLALSDPTLVNYKAMSMIMEAFVFQRVVDLYNNAPFTTALQDSKNFTPPYDNASDIYKGIVSMIDSAVTMINAAKSNTNAEAPGQYDVLFGVGTVADGTKANAWVKTAPDKWIRFANTLKLKILMRLTETAAGPAFIKSELSNLLTPASGGPFLLASENAGVNPGYSTASNMQENPYYLDVAFTVTGSAGTNAKYWRANSYAVNFYKANNDPRAGYFYAVNTQGAIQGRKIGSIANEGNDFISGVNGPGNAKSASQDAVILGAFESFFLQAEAVQRAYLTGNASQLYQTAVEESFKLLGVTNAVSSADAYIGQSNDNVNFAASSNPLKTLITQKWAACNSYDPLESFSDWRRLKYPSDLPVSDYPGDQAPHIPYRLVYPTSEGSYNSANLVKQGNIDIFNSKIFWQP